MPLPIGSPAKALKSLVAPAWGLVQTARQGRTREPIRSLHQIGLWARRATAKRLFLPLRPRPQRICAAVLAVSWHGRPATAGSRGWQRRGRVAVKDTVRARPAFSVDGASNTIKSCDIVRSKWRASMAIATWIWLTALGGLLLSGGAAFADKRVALVIGNSSYAHAPALDNPVNDARAVCDAGRRGLLRWSRPAPTLTSRGWVA